MRLPPSRYILPNLFTLAAAFCGVACIWMASTAEGARQLYLAATLIPLGVLLDGFDGRVARWVQGQSKFGVQMDSLSDMLTFGVAPAFLVYFWALEQMGFWGLVTAFAFVAASMIRLARFNVQAEEDGGASPWFTGLPAPMAGMAMAGLVAVDTGWLGRDGVTPGALPFVAAFVLIFATLMVSEVPFRTFKDVRMTPRVRLAIAAASALVVGISLTVDWMAALSTLLFVYVVSGLAGSVVRRRRRIAFVRRGGRVEQALVEDELELFDSDDR